MRITQTRLKTNMGSRLEKTTLVLAIVCAVAASVLMSGAAAAGPAPTPITVSLPIDTFDTSVPIANVIIEPVVTTFIDSGLNYIGFQGNFTFDSAVVSFSSPEVQPAGLTATNWNVSGGVLNTGPGTIKTLRISGFSPSFTPLNGSGILFNLRMLRVSGTQGAMSPLAWKSSPDNFSFIDPAHTPNQNNGLITITGGVPPTPTPTPTPPPLVNISGDVSYCPNPVPGPVSNVTLSLIGTSSGSTSSDGSGNYTFASLASGGNYTVTPTKAALTPGSLGINTLDVISTQRHFLGVGTPLSGCKLAAADVNGDASINTIDVLAIQRFFLGRTFGIANVGQYQFIPANRTYSGIVTNQTAQNYDTLVFGDVASPFAE